MSVCRAIIRSTKCFTSFSWRQSCAETEPGQTQPGTPEPHHGPSAARLEGTRPRESAARIWACHPPALWPWGRSPGPKLGRMSLGGQVGDSPSEESSSCLTEDRMLTPAGGPVRESPVKAFPSLRPQKETQPSPSRPRTCSSSRAQEEEAPRSVPRVAAPHLQPPNLCLRGERGAAKAIPPAPTQVVLTTGP